MQKVRFVKTVDDVINGRSLEAAYTSNEGEKLSKKEPVRAVPP